MEALRLIHSNTPRSQRMKGSIEKISEFGERVHAELDIEVFRHKLLRPQVLDRPGVLHGRVTYVIRHLPMSQCHFTQVIGGPG
jgi:hypothetical protein